MRQTGITERPKSCSHHLMIEIPHDPQRPGNNDKDNDSGKDNGYEVPAHFRRSIQVKKIHQMYQHLNNGTRHDPACDDPCGNTTVHNQPERDRRQNDRQEKAGYIRHRIAVSYALCVCRMSHGIAPIR